MRSSHGLWVGVALAAGSLYCAAPAAAVDRTSVAMSVIWYDPQEAGYVFSSFEMQLYDELAPKTVINFKKYIDSGEFQYSIIHRSAKYQDGSPFVIQGGGFWLSEDADSTVAVHDLADYGQIPNEFKPGLMSNSRGTIAMARTADLNSATSQWFVNLSNNTALDNPTSPYTVFGEVTEGMDFVDSIADLPAFDFSYGTDPSHAAFGELPVVNYDQNKYWAEYPLTFQNFLFTDVEILAEPLLADLNDDGVVNALDISPFVTALTTTTLPYQPQADCNEDGVINSLDISGFISAMTGSSGTPAPEPASFASLFLAALALHGRRHHRA